MKRLLGILLITLGLSFSLIAQQPGKRRSRRPPAKPPVAAPSPQPAEWVKFTSTVGDFSVLIPGTPTYKLRTEPSEHGPYHNHLLTLRDARNVFIIGWADYPASFNFNRQAEIELNRDNFIDGMKAKLLTSQSVIVDGYRGIEFTAETADKIFTSRVYVVGRRPYQIVIGSPKGEDDSVNINRFLNSFKVTPT